MKFMTITKPGAKTLILSLAASAALFLPLGPWARAQDVDDAPAALNKMRAALCLKAGHAPLADLEGDLDHLAVLSESCRVERGARACGLAETALPSGKLEDRYAYYVRQPVEAHAAAKQVGVDKRNWQASR